MEPVMTMRRPASGAPIAGVCAALAERTGIDPLIIRVAAILLAVSSGIGLVLYVAGWLLIPREGHDRGILLDTFPALATVPRWALLSILAVALVAVAVPVGQLTPTSSFPAVVIGLVYYFGVYRPRHGRGAIDSRHDRAAGAAPSRTLAVAGQRPPAVPAVRLPGGGCPRGPAPR